MAESPRHRRIVGLPARAVLASIWTALLVAGAGIVATLILYQSVQKSERMALAQAAQDTASRLAEVSVESLRTDTEALRLRAGEWSRAWPIDARRAVADMEVFLTGRAGFEGLALLAEGEVVASYARPSGNGALAAVAQEAATRPFREPGEAAAAFAESVHGPLLLGGRTVLAVEIPLRLTGARASLLALFVPESALARLVGLRFPGYAASVSAGGAILFRRDEPAEAAPDWWRIEQEAPVPFGPPWHITLTPTEDLLQTAGGALSQSVVIGGVLVSFLLAVLVHVGQLSSVRADLLQEKNLQLLDKIEVAERAEGALRNLNQELEARVAERTARLQDAVAELETFNDSVSHDLRTPLGAVVNFAAILAEDYEDRLDDTGREFLRRMSDSAQSAVAMMDGLLAYSRAGRGEIAPVQVDMTRLAQEVADELLAAWPENAKIEVRELPPAWADPTSMRLVLSNLLGNALKFSGMREEPCIEISGAVGEDVCTWSVRDNGIGFDMRYAAKLFRVFERLNPEEFSGHGIGLALVARVVRRHGGRIWAEGAPDAGAAFHFALPAEGAAHDTGWRESA